MVLPSGKIIKTRSRARKSSAGWDATKLFIGAEGTLGIVTEGTFKSHACLVWYLDGLSCRYRACAATLRLAPKLPTSCAVVNFPNIESAAGAVAEMWDPAHLVSYTFRSDFLYSPFSSVLGGHPIQCVELLDDAMITAINQAGISTRQYPEKDSLFLKFVGSESATDEAIRHVRTVIDRWGGKDFEASQTAEESTLLWQGRKTALWSAMAMHPGEYRRLATSQYRLCLICACIL